MKMLVTYFVVFCEMIYLLIRDYDFLEIIFVQIHSLLQNDYRTSDKTQMQLIFLFGK